MEDSDSEQEKEVIYPPYHVRVSDMDNKLVKQLVYYSDQFIQNEQFEKDAAIKLVEWVRTANDFQKLGEGEWQCVIGNNFGCSLTFDSQVLTFFDILGPNKKSVLIFKSGGYN